MRKTGRTPIILLDDVYHKLDNKRIKLLNKYIEKEIFKQVFITDSVYERLEKIKKLKDINIIELDNEEKI